VRKGKGEDQSVGVALSIFWDAFMQPKWLGWAL